MGVYQDARIDLSVPLAAVPALAAELRTILKDGSTGDDLKYVGDTIVSAEGVDPLDADCREEDDLLTIYGMADDGRLNYHVVDELEKAYAKHGATGTIETRYEGEDALRVFRNGKVLILEEKVSFYRGEGDLISSALTAALDYIHGKQSEGDMLAVLQAAARHNRL